MQFQIIVKSALVALIASQFCLASIKYSGFVKNSAGKPVVHAQVTLRGSSLTAFTDSSGAFLLTGEISPMQGNFLRKVPFTLSFHGNNIIASNDATSQKSIEIYNLRGTRIASAQGADRTVSLSTGRLTGTFVINVIDGITAHRIKRLMINGICSNASDIILEHATQQSAGNLMQVAGIANNSAGGANYLVVAKSGYASSTATIQGSMQTNIILTMNNTSSKSPYHKFTFSPSDTEIVANSAALRLPLSMPGQKIMVSKIMNRKGKMYLKSNSPLVKTSKDVCALEQKEHQAYTKKFGSMSEGLSWKYSKMKSTDSMKVMVGLRIQPHQKAPNLLLTPHSALKAWALQDIKRKPLVNKKTFLQQHILSEASLKSKHEDSFYKNSQEIFVITANKATISALSYDKDVASVSEYNDPKPCCVSCHYGNLSNYFITPPCLSTLSDDAYNHAWEMDENCKGQGVNAATFENSVRPNFFECIKNTTYITPNIVNCDTNAKQDTDIDGNFQSFHAEQTFRCLTNTAPYANFSHLQASYFIPDSLTDSLIIALNLQTLSESISQSSDPTDLSMRWTDSWAYRYPFPVICNPTGNSGYCHVPCWGCYNAINVGNVRNENGYHYVLDTYGDTTDNCEANIGVEQARNPPPRYFDQDMTGFDCSACADSLPLWGGGEWGKYGDRELPMIVAPGIASILTPNTQTWDYLSRFSDSCIMMDSLPYQDSIQCGSEGTSYSAPILNGIAACVISADSRLRDPVNGGNAPDAPEKVRAILLATAQNVDFDYWFYKEDGRDGAGVVSGSNAVNFAKNYETPRINDPTDAKQNAVVSGYIDTNFDSCIQCYIKTPAEFDANTHLRAVLTWSSSPVIDTMDSLGNSPNELSDLDLTICADQFWYYMSGSIENNVEMIDVDPTDLTPNNTYQITIWPNYIRIPHNAVSSQIYYVLAWTWVKDHAD